ncbi:MAG: tryptophan--tRNA ligase [Ktedonobacteraceae bacterium]|nr:tryptophan--tRNA ligase [Ktedonobacteraceae bacterium]
MVDSHVNDGNFPARVVSGLQPTDMLHLGNYFAAIKQHIELQHEYPGESFYFIADYQALISIRAPEQLRRQSQALALDYLALGLDPNKAIFYRQSDVPQVCELMWILTCVTRKAQMDYMRLAAKRINSSIESFLSSQLAVADILALRATIVPVGEDQDQRLIITRNIAMAFNTAFDTPIFPIPTMRVNDAATGTDGRKMSKSYNNAFAIFAAVDELGSRLAEIKRLARASSHARAPKMDTIFALYRLMATPEQQNDILSRYQRGGITRRQAQAELQMKLKEFFDQLKTKRHELEQDLDTVEDILREGARRAREEANETLEMVRDCVGVGQYRRFGT